MPSIRVLGTRLCLVHESLWSKHSDSCASVSHSIERLKSERKGAGEARPTSPGGLLDDRSGQSEPHPAPTLCGWSGPWTAPGALNSEPQAPCLGIPHPRQH